MNFFKRAITSIQRRPGKTIILLLLVFILGTVISGAVSVRGAVGSTEANLRNRMRPIVSFMQDYDGMWEIYEETGEWLESRPFTADMVREIADLEYVSQFHYSISVGIATHSLEEWEPWMDQEGNSFIDTGNHRAHIPIRGTSTPEPLEVREEFVIMTGESRTFTEAEITTVGDVYPVLMSTGFARHNNLSLGQEFDITITIMYFQEAELIGGMWDDEWESDPANIFMEETFTFEVIGLFEAPEVDSDLEPGSEEEWLAQMRSEQHLRSLIVPNVAAEFLHNFMFEGMQGALAHAVETMDLDEDEFAWFGSGEEREIEVTSIMELRDAADLEAFREAASEILPESIIIEDLSNTFSDISSSMENLQGIANMVLWVAVGATLLILSLLITLFLRDRRHEMGVYLALGEKKSKIVSQILMEVVMTAFVGITLAVFTGNIISTSMSRTMLRNELAAEQNNMDIGWSFGGGGLTEMGFAQDMTIDEMVDAFDVSLSFGTIGLLYIVGLGAVVLSTVVPVVYVVTLNPKKVLM